MLERSPRRTEHRELSPKVEAALRKVEQLATNVTGAVVGYAVDEYEGNYGRVTFAAATEAETREAVQKNPRARMVCDDMFCVQSESHPTHEHGVSTFMGQEIAAYEMRRSATPKNNAARYTLFGEQVTEKEFEQFQRLAEARKRAIIARIQPKINIGGTNVTYGEAARLEQ